MPKVEPKPAQLKLVSYIFIPRANSITSGSISFFKSFPRDFSVQKSLTDYSCTYTAKKSTGILHWNHNPVLTSPTDDNSIALPILHLQLPIAFDFFHSLSSHYRWHLNDTRPSIFLTLTGVQSSFTTPRKLLSNLLLCHFLTTNFTFLNPSFYQNQGTLKTAMRKLIAVCWLPFSPPNSIVSFYLLPHWCPQYSSGFSAGST